MQKTKLGRVLLDLHLDCCPTSRVSLWIDSSAVLGVLEQYNGMSAFRWVYWQRVGAGEGVYVEDRVQWRSKRW